MHCPQCHHENVETANFCQECGQKLHLRCSTCGFAITSAAKFCPECGERLDGTLPSAPVETQLVSPQNYTPKHLAEKILINRSALEGERKSVTVFFCDLDHSTALAERLGPEIMHTLLQRFFALSLTEVHRFEGTINQFLGDGFMALFGAPIAYEDHARRAVFAALSIQRTLREQHAELGEPYGVELTVRMGLNTGIVVVGSIGDNLRMDYTAVGDTTNLAARLQQLAASGTILVSQATAELVQRYIRIETLGTIEVKGRHTPVTTYRVEGRKPRRSPLAMLGERALSRFVGREAELAVLHELLAQIEESEGQVVGIVGEAGAGKSRLLYEFRRRLRGKRIMYLEGYCPSYGRAIPYLPLLDILRHNCRIVEADTPETIAEKVRLGLQEVGMDPEEGAPYLLHLLGLQGAMDTLSMLSPEAIKAHTFTTLCQMSLHGSRRQPLVFAVEDLQWIDRSSEEYLAMLIESLAGARVLFLATYRPGYRPPWMEKSYATQISLHHLGAPDSLAVVRAILPPERFPDVLVQGLLAKAEGNPFFLEELARSVAEREVLSTGIVVPDTVQGVLMARIDRLADTPKRLLQTASVLGREVPLRLLEAVWEGAEPLDPYVRELQRLEFLYEQSGSAEPIYFFKHALTQEVAYTSLLTSRCQTIHAAIGRALERLYAGHLDDVYDRLAHHYAKTTEAAKAVEYLIHFAEKAARGFAHAEVVDALQEALGQAERLPAAERDACLLDVILRQVHALIFLGRFPETLDLLVQHQSRLDQLHDATLAGPYYFWLALTQGLLGDQQQAGRHAQRALEEARQCGDKATMGQATYVLSMERYWSGHPGQGVEYGQQAVRLLKQTEQQYWLGMAYFYLGLNTLLMGAFAPALEALQQAQAIAEETQNPRLQSVVAWATGWLHATRGEWETGISLCQRGLECSPDPLNTAGALGYLGTAYFEKGEAAQAIPLFEQSIQQWQQFRFPQLRGWFTTLLGEACLLHGDTTKGQEFVRQGLAIARDVKFAYGIGVGQRALGRLAQTQDFLAEAELHCKEALQTFTAIPARFEVARTYLALAELAHRQEHQDAAAQHLEAAGQLFAALQVPRYVERTARLAHAFGFSLPPNHPC